MTVPQTVEKPANRVTVVYSPQSIANIFAEHVGVWKQAAATVLGQEEVNAFTYAICDNNPIHKRDAEYPVVPGMMNASSLPRFLQEQELLKIDGFGIMFDAITVNFSDIVFVGESVFAIYRFNEPVIDRAGAMVPFEFKIRLTTLASDAVIGTGALRYIRTDLMNRMIKRAAKRLEKQ